MKEILEGVLATDGLMDIGYDYIEDCYTGPNWWPEYDEVHVGFETYKVDQWKVLDCRHLEDGPGNPLEAYELLINRGCDLIDRYGKVMVGCTAGISRSNSIAAGILMKKFGYSRQDALDLVHEKVKTDLIEQAHLNALKKLELKWGG